jgi:hypothetical protein
MKICNLSRDRYSDFFRFNREIYPTRKDVEERFQAQILNNPLLEDKSSPNVLVAHNEDDQIIGQFVLMPFEYHFDGMCSKGFFGCDYFVLRDHKGSGAGALLALRAIGGFRPYFTFDASETAKNIGQSLGAKTIGDIYKFLWIRNIAVPIRVLFYQIFGGKRTSDHDKFKDFEFPRLLSCKSCSFELVDSLRQWKHHSWNDSVLEFSRSGQFINWRFLSRRDRYFFYRLTDDSNSLSYFVVRKAAWKGLSLLALVDYRVPFGGKRELKLILIAVKLLARMARCEGVITMSSHRFFDRILRGSLFVRVGERAVILTSAKLDVPQKRIKERTFVYATMADGDIDFDYYGHENWGTI